MLFATLAYAVQRGRYPKDVEPDLRVSNVEVVSEPLRVDCTIENNSETNRAENIVITVDINLPSVHMRGRGHVSRMLSKDRTHIVLDFDDSHPMLRSALDSLEPGSFEGALRVMVKYSTPRELLLFLLNPVGLALKTYDRSYKCDLQWYDETRILWGGQNLRIF